MNPNDIQIESGVPYNKAEARKAPVKNEPHPLEPKLRSMAPGDSFFIAGQEAKDMATIHRLGDRIGVYLQSRTIKDEGGVRTWRRNLEQLPAKRQEAIKAKVASGEFEEEDTSYRSAPDAIQVPEPNHAQREEDGVRYWLDEMENRHYRTEPGDDIEWFKANCRETNEKLYLERTRYWAFSDGRKPTVTRTAIAGQGYQDDPAAEELIPQEYADELAAYEAQHGAPGYRYFINAKTETPIRVDAATAGRYIADPEGFHEVSEKEYEAAMNGGDEEDLDDL